MNRRDFLTRAAMLAGQLAVDPEFLLWRPKALITVPALASWHWDSSGPVERTVMYYVVPGGEMGRIVGDVDPALAMLSGDVDRYIRAEMACAEVFVGTAQNLAGPWIPCEVWHVKRQSVFKPSK